MDVLPTIKSTCVEISFVGGSQLLSSVWLLGLGAGQFSC